MHCVKMNSVLSNTQYPTVLHDPLTGEMLQDILKILNEKWYSLMKQPYLKVKYYLKYTKISNVKNITQRAKNGNNILHLVTCSRFLLAEL